ncbi:hypothetical protein GCM10023151_22610 [Kangiella marina]|uniref:Uncharacterized protein n=1 Tax=Kangiella marina TaxID=1079178 RepID=A0ABP8IPN2_9GAMM
MIYYEESYPQDNLNLGVSFFWFLFLDKQEKEQHYGFLLQHLFTFYYPTLLEIVIDPFILNAGLNLLKNRTLFQGTLHEEVIIGCSIICCSSGFAIDGG